MTKTTHKERMLARKAKRAAWTAAGYPDVIVQSSQAPMHAVSGIPTRDYMQCRMTTWHAGDGTVRYFPDPVGPRPNKYKPHQGKAEKLRRQAKVCAFARLVVAVRKMGVVRKEAA